MMRDAAAGEDARQPVGFLRMLPRARSSGDVNLAARQVAEQPRIRGVREIVDRVVEVEVVVVQPLMKRFMS
jgi:hypothetical protein